VTAHPQEIGIAFFEITIQGQEGDRWPVVVDLAKDRISATSRVEGSLHLSPDQPALRLRLFAGMARVPRSLLDKFLQLRKAYADAASLKMVEKMGVGFARLTDVLSIEDADERHELLRRAKEEGWSDEDVKAERQKLKGSKRGTRSGRPRRADLGHGFVADLGTLTSRTRDWVAFDTQVWSCGQYAAEVERMLKDMPEQDRKSLSGQVTQLLELLKKLVDRSGRAFQELTELAAGLGGPDSAAA
jgi:hypothetical protein